MKIIRINESQYGRLFEAYSEKFSFEELSSMGSDVIFHDGSVLAERMSNAQYEYCRKHLGESFGNGSSRCVFTLSDNTVLKLAHGERFLAGIDQNRLEYEIYMKTKSPLLARVLDCDENFTYLVCESVVPCEDVDFEKILGIPFWHVYKQKTVKNTDNTSRNKGDVEVGYDKYFDELHGYGANSNVCVYDIMCYIEHNYVLGDDYVDSNAERIINNIPWFKEFIKLVKETKLSDFCQPSNFGIVNRDGKPQIVILDGGMNLDIWDKHYRRY